MPQPRKHNSPAARQAAYHKRCQERLANPLKQKGLPPLPAISTMPGWVRWQQAMSAIESQMTTVADEMQDYHDERSERWQESERAADFLQQIEDLRTALDLVEGWLAEVP